MKRTLSLFLLASMLLATACGSGEGTGNSTNEAGEDNTDAPDVTTELSRENTPDSLPDNLDFGGRTIRIIYNDDGLASSGAAVNEIEGIENAGDVVNDAVFQRNIHVEERLNVKFEMTASNAHPDTYSADIQKVLLAGDDLYDIVVGTQYRQAVLALEGLFHDLSDAPYLDYSKPWWQDSYMNTSSIHADVRYMLIGDISLSMISNMSAVFYNRNLYKDNFGDPNDLYSTVLSGKWTADAMRKLMSDVYQDVNGDTIANPGDIFGMGTTKGSPTDHFVYCMGFQVTGRDGDGYPILLADQSRNAEVAETLYELLYETEGVYLPSDAGEINTVIPKEFSDGHTLFLPARLSYAASMLREMKDDYGIIPHPKLNEQQKDYVTLVHDAANVYTIPVTCTDIDAVCAALEAMCAENYRTAAPAYYEVALKVKYTRDDLSGQILDMIKNGAVTDFMYVNNYAFQNVTLGTICRVLMGNTGKEPTKDFMSSYESMKSSVETQLEKLISEFKAK